MSRDWRLYVEDIAAACAKIEDYTVGMTQEVFVADTRTFDAVVRNLEIIGEASKRIPVDVQQRIPSIDWRKMAGLRDVLAHAYFGIDNDILWDIVTHHVPVLDAAVRRFRQDSTE